MYRNHFQVIKWEKQVNKASSRQCRKLALRILHQGRFLKQDTKALAIKKSLKKVTLSKSGTYFH